MTKPTYEELAAQVERLRSMLQDKTAIQVCCGQGVGDPTSPFSCCGMTDFDWPDDVVAVLSETPAQSLAALKAQWQAEALDQCVKSCKLRVFDGPDIYSEAVLEFARELIQNTGAKK